MAADAILAAVPDATTARKTLVEPRRVARERVREHALVDRVPRARVGEQLADAGDQPPQPVRLVGVLQQREVAVHRGLEVDAVACVYVLSRPVSVGWASLGGTGRLVK